MQKRTIDRSQTIHRHRARNLRVLFAVLAVVCVFAAVFTIYAASGDEVEYIYFDLAAGSVTVQGSSYTGSVYQKNGDSFTKVTISGTIADNQAYYVYQSYGGASAPDGYFVDNGDGTKTYTLPQRTAVTNGTTPWGDYITNNSDVEAVITAWNTNAPLAGRQSTPNTVTVTGKVNVDMVIDNLWSSYEVQNKSKKTGGIVFWPQTADSHLTLQTVGDNRFSNIFYSSQSLTTDTLTIEEKVSDSTLTVCNLTNNAGTNYWCAAIGGNDDGTNDPSRGIIINSGTIFAGTTEKDDCTAIGGGGNGYGSITITGGRVTATVASSGAAIGGGIGKTSNGGQADVTIGGNAEVYAYNASCTSRKKPGTTENSWYSNKGVKYIPAAAIGGGSSAQAQCSACTVTIQDNAVVYAQTVGGAAIGGGSSADNHGGNATVKILGNAKVTAKSLPGTIEGQPVKAGNAIGGGTGGKLGNGGYVDLTVDGTATLNAGSVGGGGTITDTPETYKIGYATIKITGGTISAQFIMAGGASKNCTLTMTGGVINNASRTRSNDFVFLKEDGGAIYIDDANGVAKLSGGMITTCDADNGGAIYMTAGTVNVSGTAEITNCSATNGGAVYMGGGSFKMSGGSISSNAADVGAGVYLTSGTMTVSGGTISDNAANENGGAAYLGGGTLTVSDGTITENTAINGGVAYVANGNVNVTGGTIFENNASKDGGVAYVSGGGFAMSGGSITTCSAEQNGGAVYVSNGNATMDGGTITSCTATVNGGAVCVDGGEFTISNGTVSGTQAVLGGAVYVSGGNANVHGGTLTNCTASESGGAIYVNGGQVQMLGGDITQNKATSGSGGAIYVTGTTALQVYVKSGTITSNNASANGGAISVVGQSTEAITVQIGVNELHYNEDGSDPDVPCNHNGALDGYGNCPIVENNTCDGEGGAIYISGTETTYLNIYCIEENGNRGDGNAAGGSETSLCDFLKVDGGSVLISATNAGGNVYYGKSEINSSIQVTGGDLQISGTLANPAIYAPITVDVETQGGSYTDIRENDNNSDIKYYVVKYFENFLAEGSDKITGQYTVQQTPSTVPHTVWGVIYSHGGNTIVGWNTKEDGTGKQFDVSSVITYDQFEEELVGITLEMYAIWVKDFYWIKFEPNAPNGYTGSMGDSEHKYSYLCGADTNELLAIGYINLGYKFLGWSTESNATAATYTDRQEIEPLTQTFGEIITLYAVWDICEHDETGKYVFTKPSSGSVTCTCQCAYYVTMTLNPPIGAVYNGSAHSASVSYTYNNKAEFSESRVSQFTGYTIAYDRIPINAGTCTASITVNDITIEASFTIAKATQTSPKKPTFAVEDGALKVNQPTSITAEADKLIQFKLVYTNGETGWKEWVEGLTFNEFRDSWELYYIVAFYPGNENYLDSSEVASDQKFLYEGNIVINIVNREGIASTLPSEVGENARLISVVSGGYYLSSAYQAVVTKQSLQNFTGNISDHFILSIENGEFSYEVRSFGANVSGEITIEFSGAKRTPTVSVSVAPQEQFGAVSGTQAEIATDSAFTSYFDVNYFDPAVYSNLQLSFNQTLPIGTTVIMLNKADGSYWYKTIAVATDSLMITDFSPMGGGDALLSVTAAMQYQFIVDFSAINTMSAGGLTVSLSADRNDQYAPELPGSATVTLKVVTHTVGEPAANGTSATVSMQNANLSELGDKEIALVLIPDEATKLKLPIDASFELIETIGGQTNTKPCVRNGNGNFVVTLNPDAESFEIVLKSEMFKENTYDFTLKTYLAYVGDAPMNGEEIASSALQLTSSAKAVNSAKITVNRDSRIYKKNGDRISARIDVVVANGYTATVTLLHKNADGVFTSTAWSDELENGENQILIENLDAFTQEGLFCLSVVIRDAVSNTAVLEVPYYLIIEK